jgi:ribosomal protein L37E
MAERCIGGMEAVEYWESLQVPPGKEDIRDWALNRIKYETAKGIGVKKRTIKAVKRWHHDIQVCRRCGSAAGEAHFKYCPECGTRYLNNSYTEQRIKEKQMDISEWLRICEEGGARSEKTGTEG